MWTDNTPAILADCDVCGGDAFCVSGEMEDNLCEDDDGGTYYCGMCTASNNSSGDMDNCGVCWGIRST